MKTIWKLFVVALAVCGTAAITPARLQAQCAECDAQSPGGCRYGPFASEKDHCYFLAGSCYAVGECGVGFDANQAEFSLDGLAIVSPRSIDGTLDSTELVAPHSQGVLVVESRFVLRHCSGLIASIAD